MLQEYDREFFLKKINKLLHIANITATSICDKDKKSNSYYFQNMSAMIDKINSSLNNMNDDYLRVVYQYSDIFFSLFGGYFINALYTISLGYHYNVDDLDTFNTIVEDVYDAYADGLDGNMYDASANYSVNSIKRIIDFIMENEEYRDMPNMREYLKAVLRVSDEKEFDNLSYLKFVSRIYEGIQNLYTDFLSSKMEKHEFNRVLDSRIGYYLNQRYLIKEEYYDVILLHKDRYFYLNEKLGEIEDNSFLRKDIFSRVTAFSINLFDYLNSRNESAGEKDFFIECMDKVFDSDSYSELNSKLDSIVRASIKYESCNIIEALNIINELDSDKHKEFYCGEVVSYPSNTMNLIAKPKRIIDRMKYLYNRIDSSVVYDFMDEVHSECDTVSNLIGSINSHIKKEKSPFKKLIKKFVKVK